MKKEYIIDAIIILAILVTIFFAMRSERARERELDVAETRGTEEYEIEAYYEEEIEIEDTNEEIYEEVVEMLEQTNSRTIPIPTNNTGGNHANSNNTQPSSNVATPVVAPQQEIPVQVVAETAPQRCTNINNHGSVDFPVPVGNSGRWFSSYTEAREEFFRQLRYWEGRLARGEIDYQTYVSNSPFGYEAWSCQFCNRWTLNFHR